MKITSAVLVISRCQRSHSKIQLLNITELFVILRVSVSWCSAGLGLFTEVAIYHLSASLLEGPRCCVCGGGWQLVSGLDRDFSLFQNFLNPCLPSSNTLKCSFLNVNLHMMASGDGKNRYHKASVAYLWNPVITSGIKQSPQTSPSWKD